MGWLDGILEWQKANSAGLARDAGVAPGWVLPTDPAAELARQEEIARQNEAAINSLRQQQQTAAQQQAAPTAASPAQVLAEDPAWLAYQRALGVEDAQDREATTSRAEALRRAQGDGLANLSIAGDRSRREISGNYEARGVLRSGAHETRLGEQRMDEGRQASQLQSATATQVSDLEQQLAQRRVARQRGAAEQGLNTANSLRLS